MQNPDREKDVKNTKIEKIQRPTSLVPPARRLPHHSTTSALGHRPAVADRRGRFWRGTVPGRGEGERKREKVTRWVPNHLAAKKTCIKKVYVSVLLM
jgi:hypothetical protein